MTDSALAVEAVPVIDWARLGHVYTVANGKGGVGKTTTASHLAGLVASDGAPTLLIDINGQGNISRALGVGGSAGDDDGKNLFSAVAMGEELRPVRNVRTNLDLVPGGSYVSRINSFLAPSMTSAAETKAALLSLADALQRIATRYQLVVIDTPPENKLLLQLALCATRFVVVPMKTDQYSRTGLRQLAADIRSMREHNPYLMLLAAFMFASGTSSRRLRGKAVADAMRDLGASSDVMLKGFVRHAEAVAAELVTYGRLAHELEQEIENNPQFWEVLRGTAGDKASVSSTSRGVAEDYAGIAGEIFTRAGAMKAHMKSEGTWP